MNVSGNSRERVLVVRISSNKDVEEENVWLWESVAEQAGVADGVEVGEFLGELGDCYDVGLEIVEDELSVGLCEVREGCGSSDKVAEEVGVS